MNRETKRLMQRQGQLDADGTPATRRPPSGAPRQGAGAQAAPRRQAQQRTTPLQFARQVREELRQVAWPTRAELVNYTAVVLTTLIIMITLIFLLNYAFGKAVLWLFQK